MPKKIKIYHLLPGVLLLAALSFGCDDDNLTPVGDGEDFSTLATEPTGGELWHAMLQIFDEADDIIPLSKLDTRHLSVLRPEHHIAQVGGGDDTSQACDTSGRIDFELVEVSPAVEDENENVTDGHFRNIWTFVDCSDEMPLQGETYTETINGQIVNDFIITDSIIDWLITIGFSFNGDLGYALDCDLQLNDFTESPLSEDGGPPASIDGSCVFRDAAGTRISISVDEIFPQF